MISIIIPVYNVGKYLSCCLDSLIQQSYNDLELICVDDGSTDNSPQILQDYALKDKRIHIITQENQGLSGARNTGINAAKGEWMMFVDSDDWLDTNCCHEVLSQIEDNTDVVLFSYIREFTKVSLPQYLFGKKKIVFDNNRAQWLQQRIIAPIDEDLRHPEKIDSLSTAWGKLYRTKIIQESHITFESTKVIGTEDLLFNVYYFTYVHKAIYIPNPMYHYRKNNIVSLTSTHKPKLIEQWEELFRRIENWISHCEAPRMHEALENRRAMSLIGIGLNIVSSPDSLKSRYDALYEFIHKKWYCKAIQQLSLSSFPPHWKLFFFSAKYRFTFVVFILLLFIKMKINC